MIYIEADYVGEKYNLEHPRVLWGSATRRGVMTATGSVAGSPPENAGTATTADKWQADALPASWSLTLDTQEQINAIAIDTHTIGTDGATLSVEVSDGLAFETLFTVTPDDDEPIAFLFKARPASIIRLSLTGSVAPKIACIHCSEALELPQKSYSEISTPIDLALVTEFETNMSAEGQYQGRSIIYRKNRNDFGVSHLREWWVRETLLPFIKDAREYPYFLLERPFSQPTALSYRWMDQDITPTRMGVLDFMRVDL